jgi:hypothetical protein
MAVLVQKRIIEYAQSHVGAHYRATGIETGLLEVRLEQMLAADT